ncbi:hypothetical protein PUS82_02290 [Cytobacillus firmus]|uniref:hypothetical protein n=1 Tax=Cytobacillus firmus TaxID=1399 RepID=UPI0018CE6EBF|nr:hypothetical protein [Cytobacillus firmus]MDD9310154.1 hypothetical protein [Cytobacillus firmus]MED1939876.1 hypothetical protein [Cytobacillus firmus]
MNRVKAIILTLTLAMGFSLFAPNANKAEAKVFWDGVELKLGQIGRLAVLEETILFKLEGNQRVFERNLLPGETYRIYNFKPGMLGVGGGYYIDRDKRVRYQTPSKAKLSQVKKENAPLFGTYQGTYTAGQGLTGVTLVLNGRTGEFHFYAVDENPGVPSGVFTTSNTYDIKTKSIEIKGGSWIQKPGSYVTVDLAGKYNNGYITGYLDGNEDYKFMLKKVK